jgi:DNA-binding response OmpR family regulator
MGKILVIEDDAGVRRLCRQALNRLGHQVIEAESGFSGLEMVREEVPDLVLLDWIMPRMDGMETLRAIKALPNGQEMPVVMMTALGSTPDIWLATSNGADGYITKPFRVADLASLANRFAPVPTGRFGSALAEQIAA